MADEAGAPRSPSFPASSASALRAFFSFAVEAVAWFAAPLIFLSVYVHQFGAASEAIPAHLSLVATIALISACLRLVLWRGLPHSAARWLSAMLLAWPILLLLMYYVLVLIGLQSWGRVITWHLIANYFPQTPALLVASDLSPAWVLGGLLVLILLTPALIAWRTANDNWLRWLSLRTTNAAIIALVLLGLAISALRLFQYIEVAPIRADEPVALTLFPDYAVSRMQSHTTSTFRNIDELENAARSAYVTNDSASKRNVILIAGDALRPDHMGTYGYSRDTTPRLSALKTQGLVQQVDRVVAVCGESACGLLGTTRSKYVHQFSQRSFSLPEVLRRYGYRVDLILGGDHTSFYGLRQAYGDIDSYYDGSLASGHYANDDRLVVERIAQLPEWDGQPVMLQLHLMSTHALGRRHPEYGIFEPAASYSRLVVLSGLATADAGTIEKARNFYDNGVRQFDALVGQMLDELQRKGYLDQALVVVTADHGELLGEHGRFGHQNVYEPSLRVPLLLVRFGYEGDRIPSPPLASQADIAPTILHELAMPIPSTWAGQALQQPQPRTTIHFQQANQVGLYDLQQPGMVMKFWRDLDSGKEFAFDVLADPGEQRNKITELGERQLADYRAAVLPAAAARRRN